MLVLTRRIDEAILIGDDISIKVVSVAGDKVRIGIDAPRDVRVLRAETVEQTIEQNREAASVAINIDALMKLKNQQN